MFLSCFDLLCEIFMCLLQKTGFGHLSTSGSTASMRNLELSLNEDTSDGRLFELIYEKKPLRTKADYKYATSNCYICSRYYITVYVPDIICIPVVIYFTDGIYMSWVH